MDLTIPSEALLNRWRSHDETPPGSGDLLAVTTDGAEVGVAGVDLGHSSTAAALTRLWIDPEHRRNGHGRRALSTIEDHCRRHGARQLLTGTPPGPAVRRLFTGWEITSRNLELPVEAEPALPSGVTVSRLTGAAFDAWNRHNASGYAESIARSSDIPLADAVAQADHQMAALLPAGAATPDHEFWALHDNGSPVASLWVHINREQGFAFIYKVEADSAYRGKGYGRAATRLAETRALAAGLDRVRLHVFADNAAANGLYASLGYRVFRENRRKQL